MRKRLKRGLYIALFGFVILCIIIVIWSVMPLRSGIGETDPTLVFENQHSVDTKAFKESYFRHKGLDLHYIEAGKLNADTIIFVHGFPSYWYSFIRQIKAFSADYRVIAIDGLGAGRSDAPTNIAPYKLEAMTAHLDALLIHLNSGKVHLIGHDWGAAMVFGFAQKYPERVHSVTGMSAPPQNIMLELLLTNSAQQQKSDYVERLKSANPILLKALQAPNLIYQNAYQPLVETGKLSPAEGRLFQQATSNPKRINTHINWYRANIPSIDEISDDDFWPARNSQLTVPALVILGNDDQIFDDSFIDLLRQSSKTLDVLRLDDVGHWPHIVKPVQVTNAIRNLLNESIPAVE